MSGVRAIGWMALVLVTLAIAVAPDLISLPRPTGALVVDRATLLTSGEPDAEVSLPHVVFPGGGNPMLVRYLVDVASASAARCRAALYIPLVNRRLVSKSMAKPLRQRRP